MAAIFLEGEITDESPARLKAQLDALGADKPIDLHINSEGGAVFAGVAMANMIARHKGKTRAFNDGLTASIATQIFFSADECYAAPNSFFLLHRPSGEMIGNAVDFRQQAVVLDKLQAGLETTYQRKARAGVSAADIHAMLDAETWLTGSEAAAKFKITLTDPLKVMNTAGIKKLAARGLRIPPSLERNDEQMLRSDQLKQQLESKRDALGHYRMAGDRLGALRVEDEMRLLESALENEERRERDELKSFVNVMRGAPPTGSIVNGAGGYSESDTARLRNRAFNKLVLSGARGTPANLTDEERQAYFNVSGSPGSPGQIEAVPGHGGYLVSAEQLKTLQEYRSAFVQLKNFCNVITVSSSYGRWPTLPDQAVEFQPLIELTEIAEGDVEFSELEFKISDYGFVVPISNQLVEDADLDIVETIGKVLAKGAVKTENRQIVAKLDRLINGFPADNLDPAPTVTDYKALNTALYSTLDGVFEPSAKIFCNQDSFLWLSNLEDGNSRPLIVPDVTAPAKYLYRGHEIVVVPNQTLPSVTSGENSIAPILIGDLQSYLTFFERKGLELSTSTEYYWRLNAIGVRAIERFDTVVTDPRAMTALRVTV